MTATQEEDLAIYSIGTVASLSGLSPNTIRTWERRYKILDPARSPAGGRRYSDKDVERLQLLRQLTSMGVAISSAAQLSTEQLLDRLGQVKKARPKSPPRTRVSLLHPELATRIAGSNLPWTIVQRASQPGQLTHDSGASDILIVSLEALGEDAEKGLEEAVELSQAEDVLVLYHFATRDLLRNLSQAGARLLQEPIGLDDLGERVAAQVDSRVPDREAQQEGPARNPAPRFSPAKVAQLREISTRLACECPNHLATILSSLLAFEEYSQTCAHKNPADAALHHQLYRQTGRARVLIEEQLTEVIALENLPV